MTKRGAHRKAVQHGRVIHSFGRCPKCGKYRFATRKDAKLYARRMLAGPDASDDRRLNVYACGEWFHFGHLPPAVRSGDATRADIHNINLSNDRDEDS